LWVFAISMNTSTIFRGFFFFAPNFKYVTTVGGPGGWRGVRYEKSSDKNAIKHEKRQKSGPPRFHGNPKYHHKKNLANHPPPGPPPSGFPTTAPLYYHFYRDKDPGKLGYQELFGARQIVLAITGIRYNQGG
jgi:hypothetical protein